MRRVSRAPATGGRVSLPCKLRSASAGQERRQAVIRTAVSFFRFPDERSARCNTCSQGAGNKLQGLDSSVTDGGFSA